MSYRASLRLYVFIFAVLTISLGWQWRDIQHQCEEARLNRMAIRETVIDTLPGLGARYDPETNAVIPGGRPLDYYVTHDEERLEALSRAIKTLNRFERVDC